MSLSHKITHREWWFLITEQPGRGLGHHKVQPEALRRKVGSTLSSPGWAKQGQEHKCNVKIKPNPPAKPSSLHPGSPAVFEGRSFLGEGEEQATEGGGAWRQWSGTRGAEPSPSIQWWLESIQGKFLDITRNLHRNAEAHNPQEEGRKNAGVCLRSKETQQLLSWQRDLRMKQGCQWSRTRIETAQAGAAAGSRLWIYFVLWLSSPSDANCCSSD